MRLRRSKKGGVYVLLKAVTTAGIVAVVDGVEMVNAEEGEREVEAGGAYALHVLFVITSVLELRCLTS